MTKKLNVYNALRTRILDDDTDMNELLTEVFEMNGVPRENVEFYADGDLFLTDLNENLHLAIIDQNIPGSRLQGLEVIKILRERYPKVQIIFVSGTDDPKVLKEIIKLRPNGYVDKKLDGNYITEVVDVSIKCLNEIKRNLELAMALERFKQNGR